MNQKEILEEIVSEFKDCERENYFFFDGLIRGKNSFTLVYSSVLNYDWDKNLIQAKLDNLKERFNLKELKIFNDNFKYSSLDDFQKRRDSYFLKEDLDNFSSSLISLDEEFILHKISLRLS